MLFFESPIKALPEGPARTRNETAEVGGELYYGEYTELAFKPQTDQGGSTLLAGPERRTLPLQPREKQDRRG
jgi:hypothetical protein